MQAASRIGLLGLSQWTRSARVALMRQTSELNCAELLMDAIGMIACCTPGHDLIVLFVMALTSQVC